MKLNIFQINLDRDENRVAFLPYKRMKMRSYFFDSSIYDKVYSGDIDPNRTLDSIYCIFNNKPIEGFLGRSMSVSDVVEIRGGSAEADGFYYCDAAGFIWIPFEAEKAVPTINALLIKGGCAPKMIMLPDTTEAFQNAVGGYFEALGPWNDEVALICNEEGKIKGMQPNRIISFDNTNLSDVIFGDFLIVGAKKGAYNFSSLSEKSAEKYSKKFHWPELIFFNENDITVYSRKPNHRKTVYKKS